LLYINDIYVGIYYMHEEIDGDFIKARIENDSGKGNLMKYFWNVHLGYFGSDITYYQTRAHVNELGVPMYYYEQSDGNGDWTDFIDWLYYFNTTHNDAFEKTIPDYIDINGLLRMMAVESFMLGSDNMASGANYFTYHLQNTSSNVPYASQTKWMLFDADFDECFSYDPVTMQPDNADPDILSFFITGPENNYDDQNPLVNQLLAIPKYYQQYLDDYKTFANAVFGSASKQQPTNRYAEMLEFILPWVTRDRLWQMSFGIDVKEFILDAERTIANLPRRYNDVLTQIEKYSSSSN